MQDVHDLLAGIQSPRHLFRESALPDTFQQVLDYLVMYIGIQQRQTDLAQRCVHVFSAQLAVTAQPPEDLLQSFGQGLEQAAPGKGPTRNRRAVRPSGRPAGRRLGYRAPTKMYSNWSDESGQG